jgi:hypothetical protein
MALPMVNQVARGSSGATNRGRVGNVPTWRRPRCRDCPACSTSRTQSEKSPCCRCPGRPHAGLHELTAFSGFLCGRQASVIIHLLTQPLGLTKVARDFHDRALPCQWWRWTTGGVDGDATAGRWFTASEADFPRGSHAYWRLWRDSRRFIEEDQDPASPGPQHAAAPDATADSWSLVDAATCHRDRLAEQRDATRRTLARPRSPSRS